jgi:tripartite-type tricarboxylate transporter receptor subunit TctC
MVGSKRALVTALLGSVMLAPAMAAQAQSVEEFYDGEVIEMIIPTGPGGTYALYAEMISQHLPRHLPGNPTIVPQFIPSGIQAMNTLYSAVEPDGLTIAMTAQSGAMTQVLTPENVQYDFCELQALGTQAQLNAALSVRHDADAQSYEDLLEGEVIIGAVDVSSYQYILPQVMNRHLGTNLNVITGYNDVGESQLAMERGEVDGVFTTWLAARRNIESNDDGNPQRVLVQVGFNTEPDLDAPLLIDLAETDEARSAINFAASFTGLSRGLIAPPGVPEDRLDALRQGVADMMADPEFEEALLGANLPFRPMSWEDQQTIMCEASQVDRDDVY